MVHNGFKFVHISKGHSRWIAQTDDMMQLSPLFYNLLICKLRIDKMR